MEKEIGAECPKCGLLSLNLYYADDGDSLLGAKCDNCGFKGFSVKGDLVPLAAV
jgi:DNA-directed RNA polymerase subunit RPC12/RpoP